MPELDAFLPIADYSLIGNLHTTALASKTGAVDYLPFPRYDSPTVFARLLDRDKAGFLSSARSMAKCALSSSTCRIGLCCSPASSQRRAW
ncbi:trehalase-like domain-containing protein [Phaeodactylibacter luteus]|uniref:trehalase-like domain-containing protein n=1 Tax=Phaeodactylibacter luteus TaxID=1564516 RepID=UPI0014788F45|nr:trehalase-like domain-containing protein [Phaeodactylibacter luteus]